MTRPIPRPDRPLPEWAAALGQPGDPHGLIHRSYRDHWLRVARLLGDRVGARVAGASRRGEPLWLITVEPPRPPRGTTLVLAGLHAMEHVGPATCLALLERAAGPSSPWTDVRLVVLPIANPDGFRAAETYLAGGGRGFIRKNADRVDLNRNFAAFWDDGYYLNRLLPSAFAPGPEPLSEPEARAIDRIAADERPDYAVSLHAFGELIYYPYGGSRERPPDADRLATIAAAMAATQRRPYRAYQLGRRSRLFKARGCEIDHLYREHRALSFLIEIGAGPRLARPRTLTRAYTWFTPPRDLLEADIANVLPAIEHLATRP